MTDPHAHATPTFTIRHDPIAPPPYYHGTRADLAIGDLIVPGHASNYGRRNAAKFVYVSALIEPAVWGAELAVGDARQRIYIVEPLGPIDHDPNLTNRKFPGNPTKSYRTREPLRVVGEIRSWTPHTDEQLRVMHENLARLARLGVEAIED